MRLNVVVENIIALRRTKAPKGELFGSEKQKQKAKSQTKIHYLLPDVEALAVIKAKYLKSFSPIKTRHCFSKSYDLPSEHSLP